MSTLRKIVVTGCNKGIGRGIVELLRMKAPTPHIIMACRDMQKANATKQEIESMYPGAKDSLEVFHLDVADPESCEAFAAQVSNEHGQIDCHVNNAAIAMYGQPSNEDNARVIAQTNYFGTQYLSKLMLPLVKDEGKILTNVGQACKLGPLGKDLTAKLMSPECDEAMINEIYDGYFKCLRNGDDVRAFGSLPNYAYYMSKAFINIWMKNWAHSQEVLSRDIQVYTMCPGMTGTDMFARGKRTLHEGAKCPVHLIDLEYKMNKEIQGNFFYNEEPMDITQKMKF